MAELIAAAYQAPDLRAMATSLGAWLREFIPTDRRDPALLAECEQQLMRALQAQADVLANGRTKGRGARTARAQAAQEFDHALVRMAAMQPERTEPRLAAMLHAARDQLLHCAQELAGRRGLETLLEVARDIEQLGAPPTMVYRLPGELAWENGGIQSLYERRGIDKRALRRHAEELVRPLCHKLLADSSVRTRATASVLEAGVRLSAQPVRASGRADPVVCVEVAEVRRESELSERELEVAKLLATNGSYQTVADQAGLSLDSVRTYVRRVYRKLGVNDRIAMRARLIRDGELPKPRD